MKVTLTFDNGPDRDVTRVVLATLRRRRISATFFVLGKNISDPALRAVAEQAFEEGHGVGNHTFSHEIPFGDLTDESLAIAEIARTDSLLGPLCGGERLFRPFGRGGVIGRHLLNRTAVEYLIDNKYTVALWNNVPRDWEFIEDWPERAVAQCRTNEDTVIVLHDLPTGAMNELDRFLDMLAQIGGEIVPNFPSNCTPIKNGIVSGDLVALVKGAAEADAVAFQS